VLKNTIEDLKELGIHVWARQFAKRQKTWFKHQIPGLFVDSLNEQEVMNAYLKVKEWCEK
jgi:tRNA A37 N6-isopentenylltransferase MiaA